MKSQTFSVVRTDLILNHILSFILSWLLILLSHWVRLLFLDFIIITKFVPLNAITLNEPRHDKTNKMAVRLAKTLSSLIRVFAVRMKKAWVLSYPLRAQRRLCSDWVDAQADLSLRLAHSFRWFCHVVAQMCLQGSARLFINRKQEKGLTTIDST